MHYEACKIQIKSKAVGSECGETLTGLGGAMESLGQRQLNNCSEVRNLIEVLTSYKTSLEKRTAEIKSKVELSKQFHKQYEHGLSEIEKREVLPRSGIL